jgi:aspartate aminotransferase-like enzyme
MITLIEGERSLQDKNYLMIPGPTPVPPTVAAAMSRPMGGHRTPEFAALLEGVEERLKALFVTKNPVFVLTNSGTGALETAVANTVSPGDRVLALVTGNFGERFANIARAYGAEVTELNFAWGQPVDTAQVADALARQDFKVVLATHNETSTGVVNDIAGIGRLVAQTKAVLLVDGVSSIGGMEVRVDEWGIDILCTASQKAFMLPPGLAMVSVSDKAYGVVEQNQSPRFYFSLPAHKKALLNWNTAYTPAVSLFYGLQAALEMIFAEGPANVYRRHILLGRATRAAVRAMGLETLAGEEWASPTVTAIRAPQGMEADRLRGELKKRWGVVLAGGQGILKGKIWRMAHMGFADQMDVITGIAALEMALTAHGWPLTLGQGLAAAEKVFLEVD